MDHWRAAGRTAFAAGRPRVPWFDPVVRAAISALPVGGVTVRILGAWLNGWDAANLAAPVAGMED